MLVKIICVAIAIIGIFLLYVALKNPYGEISREIVIHAPANKIFPYVNNRSLANSWNPWLKMDPEAKITTAGPEVGVGAKTIWSEGKKLGTGSATVVQSVPDQEVDVTLEYQKPFVMTQNASYILKPVNDGTSVTWKVAGKNNFMGRFMCTFVNMDKMVGDTFAKGLADLKTTIEKSGS